MISSTLFGVSGSGDAKMVTPEQPAAEEKPPEKRLTRLEQLRVDREKAKAARAQAAQAAAAAAQKPQDQKAA